MSTHDWSPATLSWQATGRHETALGMRIFVVDRGAGPTVLLLHGFPTSCYDWRAIVELLAPSRRVVALDFPGYGLSDKPAAYSYSLFQQADVLESIARSLGIDEAHLVSHDVGTSIHTELLARAREARLAFHIASSTFLNGSMLQWLATITPFQQLLSSNATLPKAIEMCNGDDFQNVYIPALKAIMKRPEAISAEDEQVMLDLLRYQDGHRRLPALAGYMRERYVHRDRWIGALASWEGSMQLVWADGDRIANLEMGRALHRLCPRARYTELQNLGHFLLMEDPAAVAEAIRRFMDA